MIGSVMRKIFGSANERYVKGLRKTVAKINALEAEIAPLTDEELKARTPMLKKRLADGETLDDILPDAFATIREAAKRTIGQRHFDVQLIGGIVLHRGQIAEMRTGEGKTLVATLAVYLNALTGKGVHVVTVNDYLAKRDSDWMGQIYRFLGMTVGAIVHGLTDEERREAYACDITYGTNNEFGFDYLRDNMKYSIDEMVQRPFNFAIVDEVDSILIDEARTPLIISGQAEDSSEKYIQIDKLIPMLRPEHYEKDEKQRTVSLTESGTLYMEELLQEAGLIQGAMYDAINTPVIHYVDQALKAHKLFQRDVDYIVRNGQVVIIDEFTGRMMEGRRYSDGLHQALEAKEHVKIQPENQTLASITFQNYFRLYPKLAGMTGTAMTEAAEFGEIYNLDVIDIPTNRPVARIDYQDEIYWKEEQKLSAVIKLIQECHDRQQPVLVGTTSIEKSEQLAERLKKETKLSFNVLNARHHEQEAYIIAQAGMPGAITIATNMAGRGTDIQLGGNLDMRVAQELADVTDPAEREKRIEEIKREIETGKEIAMKAGGLFVIGTERHESRRIDNQLRGRAGRQGDPGTTQFYLSLEDDLMRLFGGARMDKIGAMMEKTNMPDDMPIQASMVSKAIESAQRQVESMHFAARKNVLEYDDVMNLQRKAIYEERNAILDGKDMEGRIPEIVADAVEAVVEENCPEKLPSDDWDCKAVDLWAASMTGLNDFHAAEVDHDDDPAQVCEALEAYLDGVVAQKTAELGEPIMRMLESQVMLRIIDRRWMAHLQDMDYLKTGIGLRAFGQRDPLVEYKNEAYRAFSNLTHSMYEEYLRTLLRLQVAASAAPQMPAEPNPLEGRVSYSNPEQALGQTGVGHAVAQQQAARRAQQAAGSAPKPAPAKPQTYVKDKDDPFANVGRNDPCPCGSGLKFKKCHGKDR